MNPFNFHQSRPGEKQLGDILKKKKDSEGNVLGYMSLSPISPAQEPELTPEIESTEEEHKRILGVKNMNDVEKEFTNRK